MTPDEQLKNIQKQHQQLEKQLNQQRQRERTNSQTARRIMGLEVKSSDEGLLARFWWLWILTFMALLSISVLILIQQGYIQ